MANSASPLLALCLLLFLATAYGRTMKPAHFNNIIRKMNSKDVQGLSRLMKKFPALPLPHLTSDPCKFIWIECSNDVVPRVTALYLGARNLSGNIPDFSSMDALKRVYLQRNSLYGPIPQFMGTFPHLTFLDLSNNHFTGALPDSLANNKKIKLNLAGNSLQLPPPMPTAKVRRLQFQFPPLAPNPPFLFPPLAPNPPFRLAPIPPFAPFLFPPLAPNPPFLFTPLPPNPPFQFPPPAGGSGGGGGGSHFEMPRAAGSMKKTKFPKILKFTLPPGTVATVSGAVYGICRCRRRRIANVDAANNGVARH